MGKKRNKKNQNFDNFENPDENSKCKENLKGNSIVPCPHFSKSINLNQIKKYLLKTKNQNFKCLICSKKNVDTAEANLNWLCLGCGTCLCNDQHSLEHFRTPHSFLHCLIYNVEANTLWCYICNCNLTEYNNTKVVENVNIIRKYLSKHKLDSKPILKEHVENKINAEENEIVVSDRNIKYPNKLNDLKFIPNAVHGLINLGNTCYFNAVLQCLARTPNFLETLEKLKTPSECNIKLNNDDSLVGCLEGWDPLVSALAMLMSRLTSVSSESSISPVELLNYLCKAHPRYNSFDQNDSHELLRELLDTVREVDVKRYKRLLLVSENLNSKVKRQSITDDQIKKVRQLNRDLQNKILFIPDQLFKGKIVSKLQCQQCLVVRNTIEPFLDLSLSITDNQVFNPDLKNCNSQSVNELDNRNMCNDEDKLSTLSKHKMKKLSKLSKTKKKQLKDKKSINEASNKDRDDLESEIEKIVEPEILQHICAGFPKVLWPPKIIRFQLDSDYNILDYNIVQNVGAYLIQMSEIIQPNSRDLITNSLPVNNNDEIESLLDTDNNEESNENSYTDCANVVNSNTKESSINLIGDGKNSKLTPNTLQFYLSQYTSIEYLTDKVGCPNCNKQQSEHSENDSDIDDERDKITYTSATKQLLLEEVPPILILHLKRFNSSKKLSKHIEFPFVLNISPYCSTEEMEKEKLYTLYGIVEHSGNLKSGHYVSYIKVDYDDSVQWYNVNDNHVSKVPEKRVSETQAYILFYKKL